ncbi:MAG TPA: N-acetylmuramoyl-L-alanine amidase [Bacillota bacterium]|nr:N-acetylmuramoyl-L-alanine amidase [Bacillota bacterium]
MTDMKGLCERPRRLLAATLILFLIVTALYCFASVFSSFGYKKSFRTQAEAVGTPEEAKISVVIDPGHGGSDAGASANGLYEKDINLALSEKLAAFLSLSDINVVMTRTSDVSPATDAVKGSIKAADLRARVDIAQNTQNCIFVSIHMNKFPMESCKGMQVFWSPNDERSAALAQCIQDMAKLDDETNKRMIKKASGSIFVLDRITSPAVLVECGFLSNASDATRLSDPVQQTRIAFVVFCGISRFIDEYYNG